MQRLLFSLMLLLLLPKLALAQNTRMIVEGDQHIRGNVIHGDSTIHQGLTEDQLNRMMDRITIENILNAPVDRSASARYSPADCRRQTRNSTTNSAIIAIRTCKNAYDHDQNNARLAAWFARAIDISEQAPHHAAQLYEQGCEGGQAWVCANLGSMYEKGTGVTQDYRRAAQLYEQGCEGGQASSCTNLGVMYAKGGGVTQDYHRAAQLFEQGCDGGSALGCTNLGVIYAKGDGVTQDYHRAAQLYEQGCDRGNAIGCNNLGIMYRDGTGVPRNRNRANALYQQACEMGHEPAC